MADLNEYLRQIGFVKGRLMLAGGTESEWLAANPVLLKNEFALVSFGGGTFRFKFGTGTQRFADLPYSSGQVIQQYGVATPSSTPTPPTGDGFWLITQAGTYTNYGGVVAPTGTVFGIIYRTGTSYSIHVNTIDGLGLIRYSDLSYTGGANGQLYDSSKNIANRVVQPTSPWPLITASGAQASPLIPVIAGTTYFFSWIDQPNATTPIRSYRWVRADGTAITGSNRNNNTSMTAPSGAAFFQFTAKRRDEDGETVLNPTIKFEPGTQRTEGTVFEPIISKINNSPLSALIAEKANVAIMADSLTEVEYAGLGGQLINWDLAQDNRAIQIESPWAIQTSTGAVLSNRIPVEAGTQLHLSWIGGITTGRSFRFEDDAANLIQGNNNWVNNQTRTVPDGATWLYITIKRPNSVESERNLTLKLELGTERTPNANYDDGISGIMGRKLVAERAKNSDLAKIAKGLTADANIDNLLTFTSLSGQLINPAAWVDNQTISNNTWDIIGAATARRSGRIPVIPGQSYTFSWLNNTGVAVRPYRFENAAQGKVGGGNEWANGTSKVIPEGVAFIVIALKRRDVDEATFDDTIKFEQGTERTEGTNFDERAVSGIGGYPIKGGGNGGGTPTPSDFKTRDFTVICLGDSSTANSTSTTGSIDNPNVLGSWPAVAHNKLGWKDTRNCAKWTAFIRDRADTTYQTVTTSYGDGSPNNTLSNQVYSCLRYKAANPSYNPDLIFLLAGGNDLSESPVETNEAAITSFYGDFNTLMYEQYPLSDLGLLNMPTDQAKYNALNAKRRTFFGALKWAIEALITAFPNATIVLCGTLQRGISNNNRKLPYFTMQMKAVAGHYGLTWIETTYEASMSFFTETRRDNGWSGNFYTTSDYTHRTAIGHQLIGEFIATRIERDYYKKPNISVTKQ